MVLPDLWVHRAGVFRAVCGTFRRGYGHLLWRLRRMVLMRSVAMFRRMGAVVMARMVAVR